MSQLHRRLNQPRWQQARRAALERDGYRCVECGLPGKLEVHHITALYKVGSPTSSTIGIALPGLSRRGFCIRAALGMAATHCKI